MPSGQAWRFHAWSGSGILSLDDYSEATLSLASSDARIVGKHYEYDSVSASQTKRYYANGTLLATKTGTTLTYVQGDHLGSSSTLTNSSGVVVSRERYSAFGERRTSDKVLTDQLYTGQRLNVLSGLYHYSDGGSAGRFYDPLLARFIMADPLLPHLASQGLNRYSANYNNPLRYKDPNGHDPSDVVNGLNEFAQGVVAQVGYNNGTMVPGAQAGLARQPGESGAMTAGRVVGDVVSIGQGVVEAGVGGGAIGGGVAACGTGVLCAAGAPAMVAGAAVAVHGATTAATAAGQLGDKIGTVLSSVRGGTDPDAQFARDVDRITKRHPISSGRCEQCSSQIYGAAVKAGKEAQIGRITTQRGAIVTRDGKLLATGGGNNQPAYHEFVRIGDRVYDALTGSQGMTWGDYAQQFLEGVFEEHIYTVTYYTP